MKNFVQAGNVLSVTTPVGGLVSGAGCLVGALFGVASLTTAQGETNELALTGVFTLPKTSGAVAQGARLYWDAGAARLTTTAEGNSLVGTAMQAAAAGTGTVAIRLNGVSV